MASLLGTIRSNLIRKCNDRKPFIEAVGTFRSMGHTVQIILQEDLPGGKGYFGDVVEVRAGYARNFLIPTKKAFYATPENLKRFGVSTDFAVKGEKMGSEEVSEDKKAADILRSYLNQKTVSISRMCTTYIVFLKTTPHPIYNFVVITILMYPIVANYPKKRRQSEW